MDRSPRKRPKDSDALTPQKRATALALQLRQERERADAITLRAADHAKNIRSPAEAEDDLLNRTDKEVFEKYGLSKQELAVAIDARASKQSVPVYLQYAHEREIARMKSTEQEKTSKPAQIFIQQNFEALKQDDPKPVKVIDLNGEVK